MLREKSRVEAEIARFRELKAHYDEMEEWLSFVSEGEEDALEALAEQADILEGQLTETEMELLPMGAKVMTYECGMRFLTDYLQGDTYFKIHREGHNLDRCRTQFKLVEDMEKKWYTMQEIVKKYSNS